MTDDCALPPRVSAPRDVPASVKGRGFNSIPVRFAVLAAVLTTLSMLAHPYALAWAHRHDSRWLVALTWLAVGCLPALVTFVAANTLTNSIRALRASTDAILAGEFDRPVDVDCACEVGGLADSFRAMIGRLNNNIVRMNVLAYTDPVTGLPNRAVISHVLGLAARRDLSDDCAAALLFIDLDGFKRINDTLGHEAGDELLRLVSDRIIEDGLGRTRADIDTCTTAFGELCTACPQDVVVARFAGDEFVVLLPREQDRGGLERRAAAILAALSRPFTVYGNDVHIGGSLGIARLPIDTSNPEELLNFADLAMYRAKEQGRNRYAFFDATLKAVALERTAIEEDLRLAIETDQLVLHYQPKLETASLTIVGVEALVRWEHPTRGRIPPDFFIGIAEQSGLMHALGDSILRMAARQARQWADEGWAVPIAVNVSTVQFGRPAIVAEILDIIAAQGLDPGLIALEVTESMLAADFAATRWRFEQLRSAGVVIAIDDFGRGYSNLSQLALLPFDLLKIDKSLIDGIGRHPKSEAIIRAIVDMAHALGHRVVAEGIETQEQHEFLLGVGCDMLQGYHLGRPMDAASLMAWARQPGERRAVPRDPARVA